MIWLKEGQTPPGNMYLFINLLGGEGLSTTPMVCKRKKYHLPLIIYSSTRKKLYKIFFPRAQTCRPNKSCHTFLFYFSIIC